MATARGLDGRVYVFSGANSTTAPEPTSEVYNPTTDSWSYIATMPTERNGATAVTAVDGRIYVFGGSIDPVFPASLQTTVQVYNPTTSPWATTAPSMPAARRLLGGALGSDGRIYLASGIPDSSSVTAAVWAFAPSTGLYVSVAPMNHARGSISLVTVRDGRLLAIGGSVNQAPFALASVEAYPVAANIWR